MKDLSMPESLCAASTDVGNPVTMINSSDVRGLQSVKHTNSGIDSRNIELLPTGEKGSYDNNQSDVKVKDNFDHQHQKLSISTDHQVELIPKNIASLHKNTLSSISSVIQDLLYWRDILRTSIVLISLLSLLVSLNLYSLLSVLSHVSLILLLLCVTFKLYITVSSTLRGSGEPQPFRLYLERDLLLSDAEMERLVQQMSVSLLHFSHLLKRLFLVQDVFSTLKFGLVMWVLTYIGSWFSGSTLVILAVVDAFTLPKIYDTYKVQISELLCRVKTRVEIFKNSIQDKLPVIGKKKEQ